MKIGKRPGKTRYRRAPNSGAPGAPTPLHRQTAIAVSDRSVDRPFPIVGVGASAGGLEAFTQLLAQIPSDTGMGFVFIQHLDPTHKSLLTEALAKATKMPVSQAGDGVPVEANHVYVIPPNADIAILQGVLTLLPRQDARGLHLPIDSFFRTLASDSGSRAIGVVLSGTASDGTEGLRAIKAEDGITLAQSLESAKFGGMPHSAINAGVVDYALALPELARELVRLSRHPYVALPQNEPQKSDVGTLSKMFAIVRKAVGVNFSEYKSTSFERRLARRMAIRQVDNLTDYMAMLQGSPEEIHSLYEDVLIHVTSFFRDPEVFEVLKEKVFPEILKAKAEGAPIRIWVAGCSTGEEVYSLAMSLLEFLGDSHRSHPIQIFGSDVGEKSIEKARLGVYPDGTMREIGDERRRRYFSKVNTGYRINKSVRDLCLFVRHDIARDPPFSKLDLVSCRNVLIYFNQALQKRVVSTLQYSLNQPGYLLLGRAENISGFGELFFPTDKTNKIFARTSARSSLQFAARSESYPTAAKLSRGSTEAGQPQRPVDLGKQLDRMLAVRYSPPGVLINEKLEILQFRGETGPYLQQAPGEPQNNLLKMARRGLLSELRATIAQAKKGMAPAKARGVEVEQNGIRTICDIEVVPFTALPDAHESLFVVTFEQVHQSKEVKSAMLSSRKPETLREAGRVAKLEHELAATKEYLQSLIEDHLRTNEDLNSANEELVSGNEELQSMNEELETAKEELQSINEELTTVNDELQSRNHEASQINSDLLNLMTTVDIAILILDVQQRIRRFTPKARTLLNVLPSDVGRALEDMRLNVDVPDLNRQIGEVIETNTMRESEVQDRNGNWYRMQVRPYSGIDKRIDGATLSLVDIDALKHHINAAEQATAEAERANRAKDQFLATLSHELRTPLTPILVQAQMLSRYGADPKLKRAGEVIERATRMQVQLIDDLLDISSIVTGKLKMEIAEVNLCAVAEVALEGVSPLAEKKSVQLKTVLDQSIGTVSGDPTRLQQVVSNLLTNAVKFTSEGGRVTVALEAVDGHARLTVSDSGQGIDPAFMPYIFDRFSQEDTSNTRRHRGLGLGLAIVHHLVEAHGGTVKAESPGPGKGSTFSVTLPLSRVHGDEVQGQVRRDGSKAARSGADLRDLRVLVVDDDRGTCDAVAAMLGQAGANVRLAESATAAMTAFEDFQPEVLLCDIDMPDVNGYTFIRKLRALGPSRGGDVSAIALTALATEEDRRASLDAGFQLHVTKPVDIDRLIDAIGELLALMRPLRSESAVTAFPGGRAPALRASRDFNPDSLN